MSHYRLAWGELEGVREEEDTSVIARSTKLYTVHWPIADTRGEVSRRPNYDWAVYSGPDGKTFKVKVPHEPR